jgi:hypothetical protein
MIACTGISILSAAKIQQLFVIRCKPVLINIKRRPACIAGHPSYLRFPNVGKGQNDSYVFRTLSLA